MCVSLRGGAKKNAACSDPRRCASEKEIIEAFSLKETSSAQRSWWEKNKQKNFPPQNENSHFNCDGCVLGAAVEPEHRAEVALPAKGAGTRLWAGLQRNYRAERRAKERISGEAASAPRCQPRELEPAAWRAPLCFISGPWR